MNRIARLALALALIGAAPACWISVEDDPADVAGAFRDALDQVARVQASVAAARSGEDRAPKRLRMLAYDAGDDMLVRIDVPMWRVRKIVRHAAEEEDFDEGGLDRFGLTAEQVLAAGRGLLLEASEDGERVLAWLD